MSRPCIKRRALLFGAIVPIVVLSSDALGLVVEHHPDGVAIDPLAPHPRRCRSTEIVNGGRRHRLERIHEQIALG